MSGIAWRTEQICSVIQVIPFSYWTWCSWLKSIGWNFGKRVSLSLFVLRLWWFVVLWKYYQKQLTGTFAIGHKQQDS